MRPRRLIVPPEWIAGRRAELSGDVVHHLRRVLRLTVGAQLVLLDGTGGAHEGRLVHLDSATATVEIDRVRRLAPGPVPRLTLIYGLARAARTEWVLQKSTELGVDRIVPVVCQRSVARPRQLAQKRDRWLEIVRQAARQCDRWWLPELAVAAPLADALHRTTAEVRLLAASSAAPPLSHFAAQIARGPAEIAMAVGPEGGFAEGEIALAREEGFEALSLGPLVLRTETAALAMVSIVAQIAGRLDSATVETGAKPAC